MKILLIQPAMSAVTLGGEDFFLYEPLALEYVGAAVAADHDVRLLDLRIEKNLDATLREFEPDVVGITAVTVQVKIVHALCEQIKSHDPAILTVVGGHHASIAPRDFQSPFIDLIVRGEGIEPFRQIIQRHVQGKGFSIIPGVYFSKDGELDGSPATARVDLDALPFPERSLTARHRKRYFSEWMKPLASIRTSKGCPYRCNFCALWKLADGKYLKRKPECILEELGGIDEPYVFFADDESLIDAPRMRSLAELILQSGMKKRFFLYGRSDTIARNPDLLEKWCEAGLERVFVGFEFFRDEDLDYIRKNSTISDNNAAVKILHDLDLDIYASFIVRPDFTKDDFAAFRDYCLSLNLNFAGFAVLTPLPGTDLYEAERDRLITQDYELFDFIHTILPTKLPVKEFYREYRKLSRRSVRFKDGMSLLKKFPAREIPHLLRATYRWDRSLRTIHRDYDSVLGTQGPLISTPVGPHHL